MIPAPLAIVGLTFREAPTAWRAALAALDADGKGPSLELRASGFADSIVRIETCSRSEWIISSKEPKWAAELLQSRLLAALPEARRQHFHLRSGVSAANYLFRFAAGLDSLVEGEGAVARQVLKAFEDAHARGSTDRVLNVAWNTLGKLAHHKRRLGLQRPGWGVQQLVHAALQEHGIRENIAVFGGGQIGCAILDLLRNHGWQGVHGYRRDTREEFLAHAGRADAVIFASGAPQPWCELPPRAALAIDVGSPPQVKNAGGFRLIALDDLLAREGCHLLDDERERLQALVEAQAIEFLQRLAAPERHALGALTETHASFMNDVLPKLLASIEKPELARVLRRELQGFTHSLVQRTKHSQGEP